MVTRKLIFFNDSGASKDKNNGLLLKFVEMNQFHEMNLLYLP